MDVPPSYKYTLRIAVFAGICEGFAWVLTSFIAIIWHLTSYGNRFVAYDDSFQKMLDTYFYYFFMRIDGDRLPTKIQPLEFFIFMLLYFFVDLIWFISSIFISLGFLGKINRSKVEYSILAWICSSAGILIVDFIFTILLGLDYKYCVDSYNSLKGVSDQRFSALYWAMCYGIMMAIAAKGFFLWIINFTVTGIMINIFFDIKKNHVTNEDFFSTLNSQGIVPVRNLPEEARNRGIDEYPRRRRTEPAAPQSDILSTSSSFRPLNVNYTYDPHIEERLRKYTIVPTPSRL